MDACAEPEEPGQRRWIGVPSVIREPADIPKGVRVAVSLTHYCSPASLFLRCKQDGMSDADDQDEFHILPSNNQVQDAFIGMACLVCQDNSRTLALRALVLDVHRNPSGIPFKVDVLYVDSGRTDVVALDRVYTIDVEAEEPQPKAIACRIRGVKPTAASSRFDLKQLLKHGTVFEAVFYTASDAGVFEVDLYAKCQDEKSEIKTYDVGEYLVESGVAKLVGDLDDMLEAVSSDQGGAFVCHNSGQGHQERHA